MSEVIDRTDDIGSTEPAPRDVLDSGADVPPPRERPKRKRRAEQTLLERVERIEFLVDGLMAHRHQHERRLAVEARIAETKQKLELLKMGVR